MKLAVKWTISCPQLEPMMTGLVPLPDGSWLEVSCDLGEHGIDDIKKVIRIMMSGELHKLGWTDVEWRN